MFSSHQYAVYPLLAGIEGGSGSSSGGGGCTASDSMQADEENAEIRRTVIGTIDWEGQYRFDYSVTLGLSGIIRIVRHGLEDDVYARSPG